jgi:hypothetical protein
MQNPTVGKGEKGARLDLFYGKIGKNRESDCNFHLAQTSPVHILMNNSGGPPPGLACQTPFDAYLAAFSRHLLCNPILLQALLEGMKRAGYGRIKGDFNSQHAPSRSGPIHMRAAAERIALGSDYPFPLGEEEPGRLIESVDLDGLTKARPLHGTALEWLNLSKDRFC